MDSFENPKFRNEFSFVNNLTSTTAGRPGRRRNPITALAIGLLFVSAATLTACGSSKPTADGGTGGAGGAAQAPGAPEARAPAGPRPEPAARPRVRAAPRARVAKAAVAWAVKLAPVAPAARPARAAKAAAQALVARRARAVRPGPAEWPARLGPEAAVETAGAVVMPAAAVRPVAVAGWRGRCRGCGWRRGHDPPPVFSRTFETSEQDLELSDYADPTNTNLAAAGSGSTPTLVFDGTLGNPTAGSLKATAHFTDYTQYIDVVVNLNPAVNLAGKTLHAKVRLASGAFAGQCDPARGHHQRRGLRRGHTDRLDRGDLDRSDPEPGHGDDDRMECRPGGSDRDSDRDWGSAHDRDVRRGGRRRAQRRLDHRELTARPSHGAAPRWFSIAAPDSLPFGDPRGPVRPRPPDPAASLMPRPKVGVSA